MIELPGEVWKKMNDDEQDELLVFSMCGYTQPKGDGTFITVMGSEAMTRYTDYIKQMINKYETDQ